MAGKYPWKRFWCPRDGVMNLSDGGFLYDPESQYAEFVQPDVVPFQKIAHQPCLALLGEPGIGKSTVMEELRDTFKESLGASKDQLLYINLNEYGDESRLIQDLFNSSEFMEWKTESHVLHLFLDSLDECKIRIPQVATLLTNRFRQVKDHLKRLRLRIACRTADWPTMLELSLPSLWEDDGFGAYELSPLRKKDVQAAAQTSGIDPNRFITELNRIESVPLAIKPVTLDFLLKVFLKDSELPSMRTQLYEKGCTLLCEELNPNRHDLREVGGTGNLSTQERLFIASRIAAISIFSRKPAVYIGSGGDSDHAEQAILSDFAGRDELFLSQNKTISEDHIRETLGTGLFSSRGADLMGFAHQTYAEFLAARYIHSHNVPAKKILAILRHSGDFEARIIPQLYETAAWIASQNEEVFSALACNEPQILLRCDEGALSPEQRAILTQSYLEALDEGRADTRDLALYHHYHKLSHPELHDQLCPWLTDTTKNHVARDVAINVAETCNVTSLQSILVDIALNESEAEYLRSNAAHAIARVGDSDTRRRLIPLALGQSGPDQEDQLKGNALRALWPDIISAEELFDHLALPKHQSFFGAYLNFVNHELAKHLDKSSLPYALQWLEGHAQNLILSFPFDTLADDIMISAWRQMDDPDVLDSLASASIRILECQHVLVSKEEKLSENASLFDNETKCRRLSKAIVEKGLNPQNAFLLAGGWGSLRLLKDKDFEWCVQELTASISQPAESTWASLVWMLFMWAEPSGWMLDVLVDTRAKSAKLNEESASFFAHIELDSEQAEKLRNQYEQSLSWQQKKEPKLLEWSPKDRIQHRLRLFEEGKRDAWWVLLREMTLEDTSERYEHLFDPDIRKLPGWKKSNEHTRNRILDAAEIYLNSKCSFNETRLLDGAADEQDAAGYKAFLLLTNEQSDSLTSLSEDVWAYWTPIFFGPFGHNGDREVQKLLIATAYEKVPESVATRLKEIIQHEIGKEDRYISVFELVENIWDQRIASTVFSMLEEAQTKPPCWGRILHVLLTHCDEEARLLAESKLSLPLPKAENDRATALQAALVLMELKDDAAWQVIWPILQTEAEFGRDLIKEFAYELHHDPKEFVSKLTEASVADLFIWLVRQFPYGTDPQYDGPHSPSKEDAARELRTRLINFLEKIGTPASCKAIEHIMQALPELDWLKIVSIEARKNTLQTTWRPLEPKEILEITSQRESVLVRNATELQEALIETLFSLQQILQGETPAAPDLWDALRPKDENHFSDWIKRYLELQLRGRGIVAAREVEIRRGEGSGIGEETDIHVTAIIPGLSEGNYEHVHVIIEVKGCWHQELKSAMKNQLVDRYLKDNDCNHGIYLVGWYVCEQWEKEDSRNAKTPKWSLEEARQFFEKQARTLSASGYCIRSVVLNTALR